MKQLPLRRLIYSAICLALAMILPLLTGQLQTVGQMLCPMHIPVLLCGFLCGWPWGLAVGLIAPFLRFALFGMPPVFPMGISMSLELAAYGAFSGLLYRLFPKKPGYLYLSLIAAMIAGRLVWGAARYVLAGLSGSEFPVSAFLSGAVTTALPGIALQLILVPLIVLALRKAKLSCNE